MGKNPLRGEAMSDAALVDRAAGWAKRLTHNEARGPGDMENAWHRLEARYGIPWRAFWALRYRKPSSVTAYLFDRMRAAYEAECARQMRLLKHELEITKAIAGTDSAAVRAAQAVLGENDQKREDPP